MFGIEIIGGEGNEEASRIQKFNSEVLAALQGTVAEEFMRRAQALGPQAMTYAALALIHDIILGYKSKQTAQECAAVIIAHSQEAKDLEMQEMLEALPDNMPMH